MPKKIYLARPDIGKKEVDAVRLVLQSKFLSEWRVTPDFEKAVSKYVGSKYGVATSSGTTAIETALWATGIRNGDTVLVPDFTHPATADAVIAVGGVPVFADVDIDSRNLSIQSLEEGLAYGTRFVVGVSLFGNPLDKKVYSMCKERGVILVEDAACSLGATVDGEKVGALSDITCFSFHPRKIITTGEGGMITTNHTDMMGRCRAYKFYGYDNGSFKSFGTNYKLSDILAAIGLQQLSRIENIIKQRTKGAQIYDELLEEAKWVRPPTVVGGVRHTYQSYTIYFEKDGLREKVRSVLRKLSVETQIGSYALHLQPAFKDVERLGALEGSRLLYDRLLTLPLHNELTQKEQELICNVIRRVTKSA